MKILEPALDVQPAEELGEKPPLRRLDLARAHVVPFEEKLQRIGLPQVRVGQGLGIGHWIPQLRATRDDDIESAARWESSTVPTGPRLREGRPTQERGFSRMNPLAKLPAAHRPIKAGAA